MSIYTIRFDVARVVGTCDNPYLSWPVLNQPEFCTMCGLFRYLSVIALFPMLSIACNSAYEPGTIVASARFGLVQPDGSLLATDAIAGTPGTRYAWELELHSTAGMALVKEVFTVPAAGDWGEAPSFETEGLERVAWSISADRTTKTEEFLVTCDDRTVKLVQEYEVTADDPPGVHNILLFIDGRAFDKFSFAVGDARP